MENIFIVIKKVYKIILIYYKKLKMKIFKVNVEKKDYSN